MKDATPFNLDKLFEGSLRRLQTEAEYFSRLTGHNPELGRLNETHLVRLLRDYLPPKIGIGTGFIVCGGSHPRQSPQCDIVLYDALNNAPLYKSEAWSIFPIEIVYGVIEVKTTLDSGTLAEAFDKCADIRSMVRTPSGCKNKAYIRMLEPEKRRPVTYERIQSDLPPRFFVFGYGGWKTANALETNFRSISLAKTGAHLHGVCNLNDQGGLYVRHKAYAKGEDRYISQRQNGFRHFLMNLPSALISMLPYRRLGFGFDEVDLEHYSIPEIVAVDG